MHRAPPARAPENPTLIHTHAAIENSLKGHRAVQVTLEIYRKLASYLGTYGLASQEIRAAGNPEPGKLSTKEIRLNEVIRAPLS